MDQVTTRRADWQKLARVARQLANLRCYLYASPRYLDQSGGPGHPMDLENHERLGFRSSKANSWTLNRGEESVDVSGGGRFQLNSVGLIRKLATLDMGNAILPAGFVADEFTSSAPAPAWR